MQDEPQSEQDIMLSIWREAGRTPEGVTIPCASESNAKRLRFSLYNALKPIKAGRIEADSALKHAMANCSLSFSEDKLGLVIRPKVSTVLNRTLLAALGGRPVQKVEDLLLGEMMGRLRAVEVEAPKAVDPEVKSMASVYGARKV